MAESVSSTFACDKSVNKTKSLSSQVNKYLKKMNGVSDLKTLWLLKLAEQTLWGLKKRVVGKNENTNNKMMNALNQMISIMKKIKNQLIKLKKNDMRNFKTYADTLWNNSINMQIFNFNNLNTTRGNLWQTLNTKITSMKIKNNDDKHHIANKIFYNLTNKIKINIQKIIEITKLYNNNV